MRVAFDTSILAYVAGVRKIPDDVEKIQKAREIFLALSRNCERIVPAQVLGELFNVARRYHRDDAIALSIVAGFEQDMIAIACGLESYGAAFRLAAEHHLQTWDALILTTAAEARCDLLLSEDMHAGLVVQGVTLSNPFAEIVDRRLVKLLRT